MATLRKERKLEVSPEAAWDALSDWEGLRERLVPGFVVDVALEDGDRIVTFHNGLVARERRVSTDPEARRLVWTVVGESPFEHYNGAAQVTPDEDGGTLFTWTSDILPDEGAEGMAEMMEKGIETVKETLEAASG